MRRINGFDVGKRRGLLACMKMAVDTPLLACGVESSGLLKFPHMIFKLMRNGFDVLTLNPFVAVSGSDCQR